MKCFAWMDWFLNISDEVPHCYCYHVDSVNSGELCGGDGASVHGGFCVGTRIQQTYQHDLTWLVDNLVP